VKTKTLIIWPETIKKQTKVYHILSKKLFPKEILEVTNLKHRTNNPVGPRPGGGMRINPRQMEKMMKRMGIQAVDIEAEEVVIKTPEKDILIRNPHVSRVNVMGQDTFQITGDVEEREREGVDDEDVEMVMDRAGVSEEDARKALSETSDLAEAIMKLKKK
jgi:nascent polypeptide-associated complex subunit alpha